MEDQIIVIPVDSDAGFEEVFEIRKIVFENEQDVPEEINIDGNDHISHHFLAILDKKAVGTSRWRVTPGGRIKLERIAVLKEYRKKGIGKCLVEFMLGQLPDNFEIFLNSQEEAVPFYELLGFSPVGEPFFEAEIKHYKLIYKKQDKVD